MKRLLFLAVAMFLAGCTDETAAYRTLEAEGFKNVQLTGYSWLTCGKDDQTCTGFSAVSASGRRVEGAIGCGIFGKGCTLRLK